MATTEVTQAAGDVIADLNGVATGVTFPFTANKYKGLSFYLWVNAAGFNPFTLTLTGMNANTYDVSFVPQGVGTGATSGTFTLAQAAWGSSIGDSGPWEWSGTVWLPAAPARKIMDSRIWSNASYWKRDDRCSDNAHDPTALVFSWTSSSSYRLMLTAVT